MVSMVLSKEGYGAELVVKILFWMVFFHSNYVVSFLMVFLNYVGLAAKANARARLGLGLGLLGLVLGLGLLGLGLRLGLGLGLLGLGLGSLRSSKSNCGISSCQEWMQTLSYY